MTGRTGVVALRIASAALAAALAGAACDAVDAVEPGGPTELRVDPEVVLLGVCEAGAVEVSVLDEDGSASATMPDGHGVTVSSSDEAVVAVDEVRVSEGSTRWPVWIRAQGVGQATVTVEAGNLAPAHVEVEVVDARWERHGDYEVLVLEHEGWRMNNGWVINNHGVAAGWGQTPGDEGTPRDDHSFQGRSYRWSEGSCMEDLVGVDSGTRGINDAGAIVGYTDGLCIDGVCGRHPYVNVGNERIDLRSTDGHTMAWSINEAGTVAGCSHSRLLVWQPVAGGTDYGDPLDLGECGTWLAAMNNHGDVVITTATGGGWPNYLYRGKLWTASVAGYNDPIVLGSFGGDEGGTWAFDINDAGIVVGYLTPRDELDGSRDRRALLWHPDDYDTPVVLGTGEAWSINRHNQVVGTLDDFPVWGDRPTWPALWTVDDAGNVIEEVVLPTPEGYGFGGARSINDQGWIIGSSWGPSQPRTTIWRPAAAQ